MEQTLQALAGILLKAIPTIVLVLLLHLYLKRMLFGPLDRVLKQRDEATAGAREAAQKSLAMADRRAAEYEAAIRDARAEIYKEHEIARTQLIAEQDHRVQEARRGLEAMVKEAKASLDAEAEAARKSLADSAGGLADQIANQVLTRRAS